MAMLCTASLFSMAFSTEPLYAKRAYMPGSERNITDYLCADGNAPDGKDNNRDDTAALLEALKAGPGVVWIGPGYYRLGNITIPEKVTVIGASKATVVRSNGAKRIFNQIAVSQWALKDILLDGETKKQYKAKGTIVDGKPAPIIADNGIQGLYAERCYAFEIRGVTAHHFEGKAIEFAKTDNNGSAWCDGGTISGLTLYNNHVGLSLSERSEYIIADQVKSYNNHIGAVISGGNNTLSNSNFCSNDIGIKIDHKENGSHGTVVNCLINHNNEYAIIAENVKSGQNFLGCNIFYATVKLTNCEGVKIVSSNIQCSIVVEGKGANQIIGNYIIPKIGDEPFIFEFSPSTIIKDNFTSKGPWDLRTKM